MHKEAVNTARLFIERLLKEEMIRDALVIPKGVKTNG